MPRHIACSSCGAKLRIPDNAFGRNFKCPKCGKQIDMAGVTTSPAQPSHSTEIREVANDASSDQRPEVANERGFSNAAFILGIISLVPSSLGLLLSFVPCIGWFAVVPCVVGLVLGTIGCAIALVYQKRGIGFPLAGSITSLAGLATVVLWMMVCSGLFGVTASKGLQKAAQDAEQERKDTGARKTYRLTATVTWLGPPGTRKIGLQHSDIPGHIKAGDHSIDLAPEASLPKVSVGQKVECELEPRNGRLVVTRLVPVSPDKR